MPKNFFGSKLNTILLLILIALVVWAISLILKDKEKYLPILGQEVLNTPIIQPNQEENNKDSLFDYEEDKPVDYFVAYLIDYEKKDDGFWYLTFDDVIFDFVSDSYTPGNKQKVINHVRESKTFRASPQTKVTLDYGDCQNEITEEFSSYQNKLVKNHDQNFWNPDNVSLDHFNSFYVVGMQYGTVVNMAEVAYQCGA